MTTTTEKEPDKKKPLTLSRPGRLELKKTVESGQVKQSFSHGRSKTVTVEIKKLERGRQVPASDPSAERALADRLHLSAGGRVGLVLPVDGAG